MVALARVNLDLAEAMMRIKANERYEVIIGHNETEINIFDKQRDFEPLYQKKPSEELFDTLNALEPYKEHPYFYFFGSGNGLLYKVMLLELKNLKKIFVFEPSLEILLIVLTLVDFSQEIEDGKIFFMDAHTFSFDNAIHIFRNQHVLLFSKLYSLSIHSAYYDCFAESYLQINAILTKAIEHSVFIMGNCAVDSLMGLSHHLKNLPLMVRTPTLDEFIEKGKNSDIAIIASTGPSLTKQLPLLKKIAKHVTIICPDASFPVLSKHGIVPDIVFTLERVEATAKFFNDTPAKYHQKPIFAMTSIVHETLLRSIKSDNIQISIRPFSNLGYFNTPSWGYLGFGMSASNMAFEFTMLAHFKYCVLIGQDLAFGNDGASHASDHIFGLDNIMEGTETISLEAYGGEGLVKSTSVWQAFLTYFEQDIRGSKDFMPTYNCTEGGVRIDSAIEMKFSEFVEQFVDVTHKKKPILLQKPTEKTIQKASKAYLRQYSKMSQYIQKKKQKIESLFLELMKFLEKIEEFHKENRLEKINFNQVDRLIQKLEKTKIFFKEPLFEIVVFDFLQSYVFSQELEIAKLQVKCTTNEDEEKAKKIEWLYKHRFWLFSLAGGMEAILSVLHDEKLNVERQSS